MKSQFGGIAIDQEPLDQEFTGSKFGGVPMEQEFTSKFGGTPFEDENLTNEFVEEPNQIVDMDTPIEFDETPAEQGNKLFSLEKEGTPYNEVFPETKTSSQRDVLLNQIANPFGEAIVPETKIPDPLEHEKLTKQEYPETPYNTLIKSSAEEHGVPWHIAYKLFETESNFNPKAKSKAGAEGIAQFMPTTAKEQGIDSYDPNSAIPGALKYLKKQYDKFGDWNHAVAAYNAGRGSVIKYKGVPPFKETEEYVKKVMSGYVPEEEKQVSKDFTEVASVFSRDKEKSPEYGTEKLEQGEYNFIDRIKNKFAIGTEQALDSSANALKGIAQYIDALEKRTFKTYDKKHRDVILKAREKITGSKDISQFNQLADKVNKFTEKTGEEIPTLPEREGVKKYYDDVLTMVPQFVGQVGAAVVGGIPLSIGYMGTQILGSKVEELEKEGVDPIRRFHAGLIDATAQGALEAIGINKVLKVWKPTGSIKAVIKELSGVMGTEFITEWAQKYPEAATDIWAKAKKDNKSAEDQMNQFITGFWDVTKAGIYEGLVAIPLAGIAGSTQIKGSLKEVKETETKKKELKDIISKIDKVVKQVKTEKKIEPKKKVEPEGVESLLTEVETIEKPVEVETTVKTVKTTPKTIKNEYTYHTTNQESLNKITKTGLKKGSNLSTDLETANKWKSTKGNIVLRLKENVEEGTDENSRNLLETVEPKNLEVNINGEWKPLVTPKETPKIKPLKDKSQQDFVDKKVVELGNLKTVRKQYQDMSSPVDVYARQKAVEVYGGEQEIIKPVEKTKPVEDKFAVVGKSINEAGKIIPFKKEWLAKKAMKLAGQKSGTDVTGYKVFEKDGGWVFQRKESKWDAGKEFGVPEKKVTEIKIPEKVDLITTKSMLIGKSGFKKGAVIPWKRESFAIKAAKKAGENWEVIGNKEKGFLIQERSKVDEVAEKKKEIKETEPILKTLTKPILNEKGSVDISSLQELGEKYYTGGKQRYFDWQKKMKSALGNLWEKVKGYIQKIWKGLKRPLKNQRGSITLPTVKGEKGKIRPEYTGKDFIPFKLRKGDKQVNIGKEANKNIKVGTSDATRFASLSHKGSIFSGFTPSEYMFDKYPEIRNLIDQTREIDKTITNEIEEFGKKLKAIEKKYPNIKLRKDTGIDWHYDNKLGAEAMERLKHKRPESVEYKGLREEIQVMFTDFITDVNKVRVKLGKKPIKISDNYLTFYATENYVTDFMNIAKGGDANNLVLDSFGDIQTRQGLTTKDSTAFGHKKRVGLRTGTKLELDPLVIINRYARESLNHIHKSPLIAFTKEMLKADLHDPITGKKISIGGNEKTDAFNPTAAANISSWINKWAGKSNLNIPRNIERVGQKAMDNLTTAQLLGSLRTTIVQSAALVPTGIKFGYGNTARGTIDALLVDKVSKETPIPYDKSSSLPTASWDVAADNMANTIGRGKVGKAGLAIKETSAFLMKGVDYLARKITFATVYRSLLPAIKNGKLTEKQAVRIADAEVIRTQGSGSITEISPIQRNVLGKMATLWQTHTINQANFFFRDVLGKGGKTVNKGERLKRVFRTMFGIAAMTFLYEKIMGIQSPFPAPSSAILQSIEEEDNVVQLTRKLILELSEGLPIGGSVKFGSSILGPILQHSHEIVKALSGKGDFNQDLLESAFSKNPRVKKRARVKIIELIGKTSGVPGTAQWAKYVRGRMRGEGHLRAMAGRIYDKDAGTTKSVNANTIRKVQRREVKTRKVKTRNINVIRRAVRKN